MKKPLPLTAGALRRVERRGFVDDTLNASIYARHVYGAEDLRFGQRFVDVITRGAGGEMMIDYARFHETIPE